MPIITFPSVLSAATENPLITNPQSPLFIANPATALQNAKRTVVQYNGVATRDGIWAQVPAAAWKISLSTQSVYRVTHSLNTFSYSLSCALITGQGRIVVLNMYDTYFDIEIRDSNNAISQQSFMFSLSVTA